MLLFQMTVALLIVARVVFSHGERVVWETRGQVGGNGSTGVYRRGSRHMRRTLIAGAHGDVILFGRIPWVQLLLEGVMAVYTSFVLVKGKVTTSVMSC